MGWVIGVGCMYLAYGKKKMVGMVIFGNAIHEGVYPPSKALDQGLYY